MEGAEAIRAVLLSPYGPICAGLFGIVVGMVMGAFFQWRDRTLGMRIWPDVAYLLFVAAAIGFGIESGNPGKPSAVAMSLGTAVGMVIPALLRIRQERERPLTRGDV